jgi:hypothetical protein
MEVSSRPNARQGNEGINFTNFLAFALGCRWISKVDFIINHNWREDIPRRLLSQQSYEFIKERAPMSALPYGDYNLEVEIMRIPIWDDITSAGDTMEERKTSRRTKDSLQYRLFRKCRCEIF